MKDRKEDTNTDTKKYRDKYRMTCRTSEIKNSKSKDRKMTAIKTERKTARKTERWTNRKTESHTHRLSLKERQKEIQQE